MYTWYYIHVLLLAELVVCISIQNNIVYIETKWVKRITNFIALWILRLMASRLDLDH